METIEKKITPQERQANFLKRWKEERAKVDKELEEFRKTEQYQKAIQELQERNAKRGTIIPE
ncbi:MAG: hypothetical protein MUE30_00155 [Spirosomaceae bacterium]|nr:hypothetical protein [Spirosomataceae bacterium]